MVNIPTSRDIGFVSTRSGRMSPSGPSGDVGGALANVGKAIQQVAYDMNDLRTVENRDAQAKVGYDLETRLTEFRANEEELFNKAKEQSSESGIGFTRQFIEGYQKRADEFVKQNFGGISEAQNANGRQSLLGLGNSLYQKSNGYEQQAKTGYYDRTTNKGLDTVRTQIRNNAAPYEELKRQGLAAIDAADMPEPWKAERRALWDADAAESKWRWKFEQDPDTAVREIKGITVDAKSLSGAITQTAGQLGIDPVDLATAMSYETGGTFDPWQKGPTTKWGEHRGLIQWGEPQRQKYGVTKDMPIEQQVAAAGQYLKDAGVKPGMGLIDIYSAINAGAPGRYDRSDYKAGGAPGTVADKVKFQMEGHKAKAAALLGGTYIPKAGDPDLDAIPYERREQLANWGQTQYDQQTNQQRIAAKERYSLMIATEPDSVTQQMIVNDPRIDDGEKATLVNSLNTAMKESGDANALLGALTKGNVSINSFDPDQTKAADKAYDKLLGASESAEQQAAVTNDFVSRTGYIPKKVQQELRHGAAGTDPTAMAQSMEAAVTLSRVAPASFTFDGAGDLQKKMDVYRAFTRDMGYSPDEAAKRLIDANDPEKAAQRSALVKSEPVKKALKDIDASTVASVFDDSWLSLAPNLGANPGAEAAMVADYKALFEEAIVDAGGDLEAAKKAAGERFSRTYGVSEFSTLGNTVIRYPVEKTYPAGPDGSHEWVRAQAIEALQGEGVGTDEVFLMPMPDGGTEADVRAGRAPRYQIFYKDKERGTIETLNVPFFADPQIERQRAAEKQQNTLRTSEKNMIENREQMMQEGAAVDKAINETVGPDWMKARAAETAVEQQRMKRDTERMAPRIGGGW